MNFLPRFKTFEAPLRAKKFQIPIISFSENEMNPEGFVPINVICMYRFLPNKRRYSIWHILSGTDHLFGKFIYLVRYCIRQLEMRSAHIIGKNAPVFGVAVNKKGTFSSLYLGFCVPVFGTPYLYLATIHPCVCVWGRSISKSSLVVVVLEGGNHS